jgi:hypothetical protein
MGDGKWEMAKSVGFSHFLSSISHSGCAGFACILGSLASVAHGDQLRGELPVHRHHLDKSPLPDAVGRYSDAGIDMGQLCPSFYGVALALRNGMGCAHHTRVAACRVLRSAVRVRRHCLQRIRAPRIGPSRHHPRVRAYAADGEAPITGRPCDLHHGYARCVRQAASLLRSDMWRPDPAFAARGSWQSAVTVLLGTHAGACEKTASTSKSRRVQILTNR